MKKIHDNTIDYYEVYEEKDHNSFLYKRDSDSPTICKKCNSNMECKLKQSIVIFKCTGCDHSFEQDAGRE